MDNNFQRIGSVSNAHVGSAFETRIREFFLARGLDLTLNHVVAVGVGTRKKNRNFDLGSENPAVLVECKSHKWTSGGNIPSAKVTVWNESMYYFHLAPSHYRKIFCVLKDHNARRSETLAAYYLRNYSHLIPDGIEIWEFDEATQSSDQIWPIKLLQSESAVETGLQSVTVNLGENLEGPAIR